MKIQFTGKTRPMYRGMNSETNREIQLAAGQEIELSDAQAERLLKDYPKDFLVAGNAKEVPQPEPEKETAPVAEPQSEIPFNEPKTKKKTEPKFAPKKSKNKRVK